MSFDPRDDEPVSASDILAKADAEGVITLDKREVAEVLEHLEQVQQQDTRMTGPIRILRDGERIYIQETTDKRVPLLRAMSSLADCRALVDERLAAYERMWDGCGCRIRYFET